MNNPRLESRPDSFYPGGYDFFWEGYPSETFRMYFEAPYCVKISSPLFVDPIVAAWIERDGSVKVEDEYIQFNSFCTKGRFRKCVRALWQGWKEEQKDRQRKVYLFPKKSR